VTRSPRPSLRQPVPWFQAFGYRFGLAFDSTPATRLFDRMYARFRVEDSGAGTVFRLVRRQAEGGPHWQGFAEGDLVASYPSLGYALQELEYAICSRVIDQRGRLMVLHGATVFTTGGAAFITGHSGSGKTTLALALAARGYRVGGDDVAFLDPATGELQPMPRCAHLDGHSRRLLRGAGLRIADAAARRHGFITPADLGGATDVTAPVCHLLMTGRGPGTSPLLTPVPQAEMAVLLLREAGWENHPTAEALAAIGRLAGNAACHRLVSGRLRETVDIVATLLGPAGAPP
jgi:hypothetical protein